MYNFKVGDIVQAKKEFHERIIDEQLGWIYGKEGIKPFKITELRHNRLRKWVIGLFLNTNKQQALYFENIELVTPMSKEELISGKIKQLWERQDYYQRYCLTDSSK